MQPQHALALFKTAKKNLVKATRFWVDCKDASRIPSLNSDANTLQQERWRSRFVR